MSEPHGRVGALSLPAEFSRPLIREARRAAPHETCGLIVGLRESEGVRVTRTIPCENMAPSEVRRTRFEIDPRRLIEEERSVRDTEEEVVGFYHSHPDGNPVPSVVDRTFMALWPDKVWLIVGRRAGGSEAVVRAWCLDSSEQKSPREVPVV